MLAWARRVGVCGFVETRSRCRHTKNRPTKGALSSKGGISSGRHRSHALPVDKAACCQRTGEHSQRGCKRPTRGDFAGPRSSGATTVLPTVAATAGERPVATPPSSCMGGGTAEVDPLLPARRVCGSTPSSYATPSSEYVQTVATRVVYSRGYGAFYVSLLAASITEIVWIFHPWTDHCCRSTHALRACGTATNP